MFDQCKKDNSEFCIGKTLLGIIIDWSDAEADGLQLAVGEEMANTLLKGCKVHWIRSYQRVADKVCKHQHPEKRAIENEAFNLVASAVQKVQTQQEVFHLFECLCGSRGINEVQSMVPGLTSAHVETVKENSTWEGASHWVKWWIRPAHLRMLSQAFTEMPKEVWEGAPATTNAVERQNLDSKQRHPVNIKEAMTRLYKIDKSFCLKYIAASENVRLSYTNSTLENIKKQSTKKANQRPKQRIPHDKLALHGPPDRTSARGTMRLQNSLTTNKKKQKLQRMYLWMKSLMHWTFHL